jgi:hypothetical protein
LGLANHQQPQRKIDDRDGTFLDYDLCLVGEIGANLLGAVISILHEEEKKQREAQPDKRHRTRSVKQQRNFERRADCLLANAMRAHLYRETNRVAYGRGTSGNPGMEPWMSGPSMATTATLMANAGLFGEKRGIWKGLTANGEGHSSTYWPAQRLLDLMAQHGAGAAAFGKTSPSSQYGLVRLRGEDGSDKDLKYEPTERERQWANDLDFYNQFSECFEIEIALKNQREEKQLIDWCNRKRDETSRQPHVTELETFNRYLERIFNGTFDHGGRLYGTWIQYVPGWLRERITIDGEETVEFDFSCMSLRMLHHLNGSDYREDGYDLPELSAYAERKFGDPKFFREEVKSIVQAMLNNDDETIRPEMTRLSKSLSPRFTRARVKQMILEKHEAIKDAFVSNAGKVIQRMDSDIALDVIVNLMDQDILALPIHDSFIVQAAHRQALHDQMIASYRKWFSFDPIIK